MQKKYFLLTVLTVFALLVASCGPAEPAAPAEEEAPMEEPAEEEAPMEEAGNDVEVFSWWTAGGEAEGKGTHEGVAGAGRVDDPFHVDGGHLDQLVVGDDHDADPDRVARSAHSGARAATPPRVHDPTADDSRRPRP